MLGGAEKSAGDLARQSVDCDTGVPEAEVWVLLEASAYGLMGSEPGNGRGSGCNHGMQGQLCRRDFTRTHRCERVKRKRCGQDEGPVLGPRVLAVGRWLNQRCKSKRKGMLTLPSHT